MIPSAISDIIHRTSVDAPGLTATVDGEEVTAGSTAALSGVLGTLLYTRLHAGIPKDEHGLSARTVREPLSEEMIARHTPHKDTVITAALCGEPVNSTQVVQIDSVRVRVPVSTILEQTGQVAKISLPARRPALSTGFYLVTSSQEHKTSPGLLRLYLHCRDLAHAVSAWKTVLTYLEDNTAVYRAKVLSSTTSYPRRDAIVVYLPPQSWQHAKALAALVPEMELDEQVSPITHPLAPGMSAAWEPDDPRPHMQRLSFGQHRMNIIATALVQHAVLGETDGADQAIYEAFIDNGIDPSNPARNLSSPPLPELSMV
ncbi:T3SS effector HopA1 family protein [Streptomyces sp. NPDC001093]|uniref:T3SS effector HopA1 family protein n=1 Tax=Streptomyces sp. NPDC001093 TaxID=3154376 RepID=UPI003319311D